MELTQKGIQAKAPWQAANIALPTYDLESMRQETAKRPGWLHFGAGNIFRAFVCAALQKLLDEGAYDRGIIACETYDGEIVDAVYAPHDHLSILATLKADGTIEKKVIASVATAITLEGDGLALVERAFAEESLQLVTFTVTEKAYNSANPMMMQLCRLLLLRFQGGAAPLAMVSMDNCAHNGDKLKEAILPAAKELVQKGDAPAGFLVYLGEKVSFPNTMIDKITPHPDGQVAEMLRADGLVGMDILRTKKGTVTAPFVNAEEAEYLVIEDDFPNGRPSLEKAGIRFTDRATVDKVEKMKVGTCLNPLHTALALLGCLLGFEKISQEMGDEDLRAFVERLGYIESLPVVEDPGVLSPAAFLKEVLEKRLPNPFLPDTPQRIAADTSQKLPVRFGWTLSATEDKSALVCVPFVFAAWFRYLMGVDDEGNAFTLSPDPRMEEMKARLSGGLTDEILRDETLFGADLIALGLGDKVRQYFSAMMEGKGAVRRALHGILSKA